MLRKLGLLVGLGLALLLMGAGEYLHLSEKAFISFALTDAGDTAMIIKYRPVAFDSFTYSDSFSYFADTSTNDTSAHQTIKWTSPVQTMIITPTVDVATTYSCSVDFVTGATVGVEKDYSGCVATVAALIDTLVDLINGKAVLTDSVTAEDSVTYIKLVSNFSGGQFGGRWTMIVVTASGTGELDTVAHVSQATVAMICDTMVAKINADAGLDSFMTAVDEDTVYVVTADKKGLLFFAAVSGGTGASLTADSLQDTVRTQDNVRSKSINSGYVGISNVYGYKTLVGKIILAPHTTIYSGLGNSDSGVIQLYAVEGNERMLLQADTCNSLPCTSRIRIAEATGDTSLTNRIEAWWYISDTCSDTVLTIQYPLIWNLRFK